MIYLSVGAEEGRLDPLTSYMEGVHSRVSIFPKRGNSSLWPMVDQNHKTIYMWFSRINKNTELLIFALLILQPKVKIWKQFMFSSPSLLRMIEWFTSTICVALPFDTGPVPVWIHYLQHDRTSEPVALPPFLNPPMRWVVMHCRIRSMGITEIL